MILLCMILFGILQVSIVTAAHDVFIYASSAGARCATIGYNDHMVEKVVRTAMLPSMGAKRISLAEEMDRLKDYLMYENNADDNVLLNHISNEYWESIENPQVSTPGNFVKINLLQEFPMTMPFLGAFYNANYTEFNTEDMDDLFLEHHADLYLYE